MHQPKTTNPYIESIDDYISKYQESIVNPDKFFGELAQKELLWKREFDEVHNHSFEDTKWFAGGKINISENCIDRHLEKNGNKIALIWEGDDPSESKKITYNQLSSEVNKFANVLKKLGAKKGSRICIYMPMIPEAAYAMLACARIGAIHSVVFGGFSPESLKDRILDAQCEIVITADEGLSLIHI